MSNDGAFERESILLRGRTFLLGGRFYSTLPDDQQVLRAASGQPRPYAVVHFGQVYAQPSDRSIMGEEDQPHVLPFTVQCYAAHAEAARATAGAVRDLFIGWTPSPGSEPVIAPGGVSFRDRDTAGTPTRAVEAVALQTIINVGSNDGSVPTPGSAPGGAAVETIQDIVKGLLGEAVAPPRRYDFPAAVGQWPMPHSFGRIPNVRAYDLDGHRLIADEVSTDTLVVLTHGTPQAGFAILG